MSSYPPPTNWTQSIFNPENWVSYNDALTVAMGNKKYLIKTGADTDIGPLTLKNPLKLSDGSVSSPAVQFINSSNTGFYRSGTTLGLSIGGINKFTWDNIATTSSQTLISPSYQVSNFGGPNAAFGNTTNTQTGIYFPTSTTVGVVQNGNYTLTLGSGQIIPFNPIRAQNGSSVVPSYSFGNSADSGLYLIGANYVGMSIGTDTTQTWEGKSTKFWGNDTGNNVGYTPSPFGYYEEYAYTTKFYFTGGGITPNINCKITRIGNLITLYIPQWTSSAITNNSGGTRQCFTNTNIPTRFLPGTSLPILVSRAVVNSVDILINMYIQSGGAGASILTIEKNIATYFANNDIFYMYGTTMSWLL